MTAKKRAILSTSILVVAAFALLALSGSAGATPQKRATDSNAAGAQAVCEALGGSATTEGSGGVQVEGVNSKSMHKTSTTRCTGGLLGGMTCENHNGGRSDCTMSLKRDTDGPESVVAEPIGPLETAPDDVAEVTVAVEAAPLTVDVATVDDGEPIDNATEVVEVTEPTVEEGPSEPVVDDGTEGSTVNEDGVTGDATVATEPAVTLDASETTPYSDAVSGDATIVLSADDEVMAEDEDEDGA